MWVGGRGFVGKVVSDVMWLVWPGCEDVSMQTFVLEEIIEG